MNAPLVSILHQDTLERLAGDGAFARGQSYFREGRVLELSRKESAIQAKVRGSEEYPVRIWMHEDKIAFSCACPQGQERAFCKHAVAVVLALVAEVQGDAPTSPKLDAASRPPKSDPPVKPTLVSERVDPSPLPPRLAIAKAPIQPMAETPASEPAGRRKSDRSLADELRALTHEDLVVLVLESALDSDAFRGELVRKLRDKSPRTR